MPLLRTLLRPAAQTVRHARMIMRLRKAQSNDRRRFARWSHGTRDSRTPQQSTYALYKAYHGIEKGLSLPEPRPGFGRAKIENMVRTLKRDLARFPDLAPEPALAALGAYSTFNAGHGIADPVLDKWLQERGTDREDLAGLGGVDEVDAADIRAAGARVDREFFWSRHSIRHFSGAPVPFETVEKAVDMARKTPSVCNRQGPRVHVFIPAERALKWQPGNAGFGHVAGAGLVVTSDLQAFSGTGERNQPFVDGGMFAMSLLYAFHALGLGSCPLAWAAEPDYDRQTRKALSIPDNEVIIMMIAVGHLPDRLCVARSHRHPLESYLIRHDGE